MRTSTPGTPSSAGFTLIELSVVLFVLGLMLWLVVPRLATVMGPDRNTVFREIAAGSEEAFDTALFEKQEVRLVIDPTAGTYRFQVTAKSGAQQPPRSMAEGLSITGIRVDGEDRPPDLVTEIRYLPGGKVPAFRIFFRESGEGGAPPEWTLRVNPHDGSVDVLEGNVPVDA
ncbi:MAG: prepilin-type N-terminal cleavage/methylation domain-containing protein [Candidatus Deferrimicrobiaceae bacterium]